MPAAGFISAICLLQLQRQLQFSRFRFQTWAPPNNNHRWSQFAEFFFYHVLFYAVLGPLAFIPLLIKPGMALVKNLFFIGFNKLYFLQTFFYVINFTSIFLFFYLRDSTQNVYLYGEILYLTFTMAVRICLIAIKYGTFEPIKITLIKTAVLS